MSMNVTNNFDTPLTQESLDKMAGTIQNYIYHFESGVMMLDEFLMAMEGLYMSYPQESLVGLIDPATGLKYHPFPTDEE